LLLARETGNKKDEGVAICQVGILSLERGSYSAARTSYLEALAIFEDLHDRNRQIGMLNNLADIEQALGNYEAAVKLLEDGRRNCSEIGQSIGEGYILCNLASVALERGDPRSSLEFCRQARDFALQRKDPDLEAHVLCTSGRAHAAQKHFEEATNCYRSALRLWREIGRSTMTAVPIAGLARVALSRGAIMEAKEAVDEILAHVHSGRDVDRPSEPEIYLTCSEVLAAVGDPRARDFLTHAHTRLMETANLLTQAERARFLSNVRVNAEIVSAWSMSSAATL
jgi:tetratricopeptide (TPR) repeat protein